jgi:hypothetical protein
MNPDRSAITHLWLRWAILNGIAGTMVGALEAGGLQFAATLLLTGLFLGTAQWFVLKSSLRRSLYWIGASAVGWIIGVQIVILLGPIINPIVALLTRWSGLEVFWLNLIQQPIRLIIVGLAQWLVLRQFGAAAIWIGSSAIGGLVQGGVSVMICAVACLVLTAAGGAILATAVIYGMGWLSYGVMTGITMQQLIQTNRLEVR